MSKFQELIQSARPVLVDFSAEWCGPCKMLAPVLKEIAQETYGKATIVKIDVDKNPQAANHYQIRGVPTLILFKNGKQIWRQSGLLPKHEILKQIHPHLE